MIDQSITHLVHSDHLTEKTPDLEAMQAGRDVVAKFERLQGEMEEWGIIWKSRLRPIFENRGFARFFKFENRGFARFSSFKTEASPEFPVASPFLQEVWGQPDLAVWYILIYKDSDATKSNTLNTELGCKTCLGRAWWCVSTSVQIVFWGNRK